MAVSYSSNTVTIGNFKNGTVASNSTTTLLVTSGTIVSGDIGRFVMVRPSAGDSSQTQVRRITSVSGGTIGINSPWVGTISSGVVWRVSHNCQDVHDIGNVALQKIGDSSFRWNADWNISSDGFFADADITLEMERSGNPSWGVSVGGVVQFGVLYGGEANNSTETTNGCRLSFKALSSGMSLYSNTNSRAADGAVVNYYGCLIESESTATWMFQRMRGPTRFIGCVFDGVVGGRFYHEASEWVDCRMSGNNDTTPAWSIGATFIRAIDNIIFYRNLMAIKNYEGFGGTFRNCTFTDSNTNIILVSGNSSSTFNFIDCTEFLDNRLTDSGAGTLNQFRSVVFTITDNSGSPLSGVNVRINNNEDTTQGTVQTSDGSGLCGEILALRRRWVNSSPSTSFSPFRIRIRGYGYFWGSLNSNIANSINQSYAVRTDSAVTQTSGVAAAHTGITVTDHGASPVSWNSLNWGITVVGNRTTNPSLTLDDIKHYLHFNLAQSGTTFGKSSGLDWHNLIPMSLDETENGTYGSITKGVRIVDENDDPFPDVVRMQSDNGTYYVPPIFYDLVFNNLKTNSEVRIFDASTTNEIGGVENSLNVFTASLPPGQIDYRIVNLDYQTIEEYNFDLTADTVLPIQQIFDRMYNNPI